MTDFLPGFFDEEPVAVLTLAAPVVPPPNAVEEAPAGLPRFDAVESFARRVRWFTHSLSRARQAEIARRPRFRNQPYLRRADDFDPDDQLP